MRARVLTLAAVLTGVLFVPGGLTAGTHMQCDEDDDFFRSDDVSVDWEDGSIVFTQAQTDETVEITHSARLIVNDRVVNLTRTQRALVRHYYDTFDGIMEDAKSIGIQGGKLGVKGAALGLKAAAGVLLLLSPHYDSDDLEADLGEDEEKLDRAADRLEKKAERLEKRVHTLRGLHEDMRDRIDELDRLGWF